MRRRELLITIILASISGCNSIGSSVLSSPSPTTNTVSPTPTPKYDSEKAMYPSGPSEDWPHTNLVPNHDLYEIDKVWTTVEEDFIVAMDVSVFDTVNSARSDFARTKATADSPKKIPLAEEAILIINDSSPEHAPWATCVFRDSNAIGYSNCSILTSGSTWEPSKFYAVDYAEILYAAWQG